jgi:hypothetical protein
MKRIKVKLTVIKGVFTAQHPNHLTVTVKVWGR